MRKRNIRVQVWLNEEEKAKLHANAAKSGLSQEAYLRILINGYVPKTLPPTRLPLNDKRTTCYRKQPKSDCSKSKCHRAY